MSTKKGYVSSQPVVYKATAPLLDDGDEIALQSDSSGNLKVIQKFLYKHGTGDFQVKAGAGFLHTLTFACVDAAPTAGTIIVYDSLTETGTIIYSETFTTTAFRGYTVTIDTAFSTGCYVGFATTADVGCTVSYL